MSPNTKWNNWSKEAMCSKKGRNGLFKSFKVLFCADRNAERYEKDTSCTVEGQVNVNFGITVLPSEHENKLVEYCITMDRRYHGLRWHNHGPKVP